MKLYLHRNFLLSFAASFISLFGSKLLMISYVAYVYRESGSATLAAVVFAADWTANLFIGLLGAQYIDRQNAKQLLVWLNVVAAGVTLVFLGFSDPDLFAYAIGIIFARALLNSAVNNARVKALVQFFTKKETDLFSPVFNASLPIAMAVAAATGAFILKFVEFNVVVYIDSATFLTAAALMLLVKPNEERTRESIRTARGAAETKLRGIRNAFGIIARDESIASAVFYIILSVTAFQATYETLITVIPQVWYGKGESGTALFFTFESVAVMTGVFLYQYLNRRGFITDRNERTLNLAVVVVITALYALVPLFEGNVYLCLVAFSLMVVGGELIWVHQFKQMIAKAPAAKVSSVLGLQTAMGYSLMGVFATVFSWGLDGLGIGSTIYVNIALVALLVAGWELPRRARRIEPATQETAAQEPAEPAVRAA
ncbi:MFS transporter [Wenjunlia tyrosinilytica]|uniref:MFS transporter n=1 Tax=Wenjunlia tyrosinilytica TaxID=1544741 RepID=A0A917ZTU5_9ACTN|nr:MFS transporter [Wenjunlia tyrosinilytica]GGO93677.1 MFS transporter [Wenjunlia tyrosinilytica]